jgi:hypothetical protein
MSSFFPSVRGYGLLALVLPLAMAAAARGDEVTDWHEHLLDALGAGQVNAVVSTRDAALVSAAVFDAVNGIERRYTPIRVATEAPRGASPRAAAVQAAYAVLLARFPAQAGDLAAKRTASLAAIGDGGGASVERGLEWGQDVAEAILAWRSTDGFTPPPPPFFGGLEEGRWRPTPPGFAPGAAPQFATMAPWGILAPDQFRPLGPPALGSPQYLLELEETRQMGSFTSPLRTADQTAACLFANGTNGTYLWNRAALDLLADEGGGQEGGGHLSEQARLLARLNLAIADGIIACWDAKYHYQFWRPVTAIRLEDPAWTPLVPTPAHPEYTSGHSSINGAAATVLADYFGEETPFLLQSQAAPVQVRFYPNFTAAVDEFADARVFAGIHFRAACEDGAGTSRAVADYILENRMQRINGQGE